MHSVSVNGSFDLYLTTATYTVTVSLWAAAAATPAAHQTNTSAADAVLVPSPAPLPLPQQVVMVLDATGTTDRREEIRAALRGLVARGDILRGGDSLVVLGVLRSRGTDSAHLQDQVAVKIEEYQEMLRWDVEKLHKVPMTVILKIVASSSLAEDVIIQEVNSSKASWVILDRLYRRDVWQLEKHISCKVAVFNGDMSVQVVRSIRTRAAYKKETVKVLSAIVAFEAVDPKTLSAELQRTDRAVS